MFCFPFRRIGYIGSPEAPNQLKHSGRVATKLKLKLSLQIPGRSGKNLHSYFYMFFKTLKQLHLLTLGQEKAGCELAPFGVLL